jgi:hypothetical protein
LDALVHAKRALRVDVALVVAVVARVGVEDHAKRAVLVRDLGLDPSPRSAVAGDDDLAANVYPAALQLLVIVGYAVVDVDQLAGDVAVGRIGVVCR